MRRGRRLTRGVWRLALLLLVLLAVGLVVNLALMGYGATKLLDSGDVLYAGSPLVQTAAKGLTRQGGQYTLAPALAERLRQGGCWAMLIGPEGNVLWSLDLPGDIPRFYTRNDIAIFSRWYLSDYPVKVWTLEDGLFVLGSPKGGMWKYLLELPELQVSFLPFWLLLALVCNFLVVLLVSLLMTARWHRRRDQARSEWIAGVSHDIRTPLAVVMGYSEALSREEALAPEDHRRAQAICAKSEEMRALIADLNLVNRLEYAMEPLEEERLSLPALLRETAAQCLNTDAEEKYPITLEIAPSMAAAHMRGNRALLKRMLKNLISNSQRHNPGGCAITLALARRWGRKWICVTDSGCGFSKEQLEKLRHPSQQALPHGGHGLGLRLVTQICAAHGGRIRFSNQPQGGGRCDIWL